MRELMRHWWRPLLLGVLLGWFLLSGEKIAGRALVTLAMIGLFLVLSLVDAVTDTVNMCRKQEEDKRSR